MRWNVGDDEPPMVGRGFTVLLDGEPVERVTELDTDEGWVVKHCQGEKGEGHPSDAHVGPGTLDAVCDVRLEGHVEIVDPDGAKIPTA